MNKKELKALLRDFKAQLTINMFNQSESKESKLLYNKLVNIQNQLRESGYNVQ